MHCTHSYAFFSHASNSNILPWNVVPANNGSAACTSSFDGKVAIPVPLRMNVTNLQSPPTLRISFNSASAASFSSRFVIIGTLLIHTRFSGLSLQPLWRPLPPPLLHPPPPPPPSKACK